jgi:hypothetical protein
MKALLSRRFLGLSIILTFIFWLPFVLFQQSMRQSANDPQIQIAQDSAVVLAKGEEPPFLKIDVYGKIDVAKSLAPFLTTYDGEGVPLVSTGFLEGKMLTPPKGVFEYAKKHGSNTVTLQPRKDVRIAATIVYYGGSREGFALSGRSLSAVESRIQTNMNFVAIGWFGSLFIVLIVAYFANPRKRLTQ